MKTLVLYDTLFGNTEKIAITISKAIPSSEVIVLKDINLQSLKLFNLLIVGSPTQGGRPTPKLTKFLDEIPKGFLKGIRVAAFDTRFAEKDQNIGLQILMKTIGYAAPKISKSLTGKGGNLIITPEGFIVAKKEGPLKDEEFNKANSWAKNLPIT
jgi:flavodoxin I